MINQTNRLVHVMDGFGGNTYDRNGHGPYSLQIAGDRITHINHIGCAAKAVPAHVYLDTTFVVECWYSDTRARLAKGKSKGRSH
jgi:hypothetical protein